MPQEGPKRLVIFGAGTLARMARAYFTRDTEYHVVACTVDREHLGSASLDGVPTIPFDELGNSHQPTEYSLFVAVGYTQVNKARARIFEQCAHLGYSFPTVVSSLASRWGDLAIGRNCLVFDGAIIEPEVQIGDGVIVWSGSQICHNASIGDHCFLGPHSVVLGDVSVGSRSFIGGNATVRDGVKIAEDCVIGAGTVIKNDTRPGDVYAAVSTQPLPERRSHDLSEL